MIQKPRSIHAEAPLVGLTASFMAGMLAAGLVTPAPRLMWGVFLALCGVVVVGWMVLRSSAYQRLTAVVTVLIFSAFALLGAFRLLAETPPTPLPAHGDYAAVVMSEPVVTSQRVRADLMVVGADGRQCLVRAQCKAASRLYDDSQEWHVGQLVAGRFFFYQPRKPQLQTDFDYAAWLLTHGYSGLASVDVARKPVSPVGRESLSLWQRVRLSALRLRQTIVARLDDGSQQGAILSAMTLGDRRLIDASTRRQFSDAGAAHVLALSGLHLGVIYGFFMWVFFWWPRRIVAFVAAASMWVFAVVVGLSPSVTRAATLLSVHAVSKMLGRDQHGINPLAVAALIILMVEPRALFDVGLQLSMAAVGGILVLYVPYAHLMRTQWRMVNALLSMVMVGLAAQIATAPLVLHYFHQLPVYFMITNLLVVPLSIVLIYSALITLCMSFSAAVFAFGYRCLLLIASLISASTAALSALPCAVLRCDEFTWWQVVACYVVVWVVVTVARMVYPVCHVVGLFKRLDDE